MSELILLLLQNLGHFDQHRRVSLHQDPLHTVHYIHNPHTHQHHHFGHSQLYLQHYALRPSVSPTKLPAGPRQESRTNKAHHHLTIPKGTLVSDRMNRRGSSTSRVVSPVGWVGKSTHTPCASPPPRPEDLLERRGIIPTFLRSPARSKSVKLNYPSFVSPRKANVKNSR